MKKKEKHGHGVRGTLVRTNQFDCDWAFRLDGVDYEILHYDMRIKMHSDNVLPRSGCLIYTITELKHLGAVHKGNPIETITKSTLVYRKYNEDQSTGHQDFDLNAYDNLEVELVDDVSIFETDTRKYLYYPSDYTEIPERLGGTGTGK